MELSDASAVSLSNDQLAIIEMLVARLISLTGVRAVALGGSFARGRATKNSDIDLGLFYSEAAPFSINELQQLVRQVDDSGNPVVSDFYGWGKWVNGGAWLNIKGQRVDLLYKNIEQAERVIEEGNQGRYEVDYAQQPPFGFFSGTYCAELRICKALADEKEVISRLKKQVEVFPEALRHNLVQDNLWAAEFGIKAFARKFAGRGDIFGTASCLTRVFNQLNHALFAINREYPINDKTVIAEIGEFGRTVPDYGKRIEVILGNLAVDQASLENAVTEAEGLLNEVADLTDGLYQARYLI